MVNTSIAVLMLVMTFTSACINMHIHKYIHADTNRVFKESPVRLKSGRCVQVTFGVAGGAKLSSAEAQARLTV